jgi:hypothetical protein
VMFQALARSKPVTLRPVSPLPGIVYGILGAHGTLVQYLVERGKLLEPATLPR